MRYEILAPMNGEMTVMLTGLRRESAEELVRSFGSRAIVVAVAETRIARSRTCLEEMTRHG